MTVVPLTLLEEIGASRINLRRVRSLWGGGNQVWQYNVDVLIAGQEYEFIDVIAQRQGAEIIIGRNFLNEINLNLNGPALTLELPE